MSRQATLLTLLLVLSGCVGQEPSDSVSPTVSASSPQASTGSSASPTPTSESTPAPGAILPPDSVARVLVDRLRVRDEPTTDGNVVATLGPGDEVAVIGNPNWLGPISADGHDWYPIIHPVDYEPGTEVIGWVAAGSVNDPFLATVPPTCEGTDLTAAAGMTAYGRLTCFGSDELVFEGTYGCGECGGFAPGTFDPAWLTHPIGDMHVIQAAIVADSNGMVSTVGRLGFRVDPASGIERPADGSIIRIIGQFDHPAAEGCSLSPGPPGEERPADPRAAVLYCRGQFVVRSLEIIGTDPNWDLLSG